MVPLDPKDIRVDLVRFEGKLDGLVKLLAVFAQRVATVEGRLWGLIIGVAGALGAALVALACK